MGNGRSDGRSVELAVRSIRPDEVARMVRYFHEADDEFLSLLGADRSKFPDPAGWEQLVLDDMARPAPDRERPYETTPGWINAHQTVNRWRLDRVDHPAAGG